MELNGTFYRWPEPELLGRWAAATPPGFRFALKAHRALTYSGAAFDKLGAASRLRDGWFALGDRAGPLLLQFPPTRQRDLDLLRGLLDALSVPAAVEFRHPSWFAAEVDRVLRERGAALVVTDQESWPQAPPPTGAELAYYRLRREYTAGDIEAWAQRIRTECGQAAAVHVYFKHFPEAPAWATRVQTLLTGTA